MLPRRWLGYQMQFDRLKRRDFITLVGGAAAAWPLAARAQQSERVRRIGVLMAHAENDPEGQAFVAAFREVLQKLGWTEGSNIRIDTRWAAEVELMQGFAKELIALQPDLILANNTPTTAAVMQQTSTIPVIFAVVADPIGSGFVASLPRPGGNVTGFTLTEPTMTSKWLELLKQIAPHVTRVAFLFNPATTPYRDIYLNPFKAAAPNFAVEAIAAPVHGALELGSVVAAQAIVFVRVADPLGDGLVDSMARPSGNVTGFSASEPSMAGKWLQLLKEIAPNVERATFMFNPVTAPFNGGSDLLQVAEAAALSVGVKVSAAPFTTLPILSG
jgi:ABC-type uncharacterized transport system substrate-binding protein